MNAKGTVFCTVLAFFYATATVPALGAPIYGISAFVTVDAGRASEFVNFSSDGGPITSGVITKAVTDNAGGGAQSAFSSAFATVGLLGGKVQASTSGALLQHGQGFDDLNWYTDFHVTGAAGSKVSYQFAMSLDGVVVGAGDGYSGGVRATSFAGGIVLGDFDFNVLVSPGPFSVVSARVFDLDVGAIIRLSSRMTVGGNADRESSVDVDAFTTSGFYVDVLTPGGGYFTDAGVVFPTLLASPVPHPATLALVPLGLVGIGLARRRIRTIPGQVTRDTG